MKDLLVLQIWIIIFGCEPSPEWTWRRSVNWTEKKSVRTQRENACEAKPLTLYSKQFIYSLVIRQDIQSVQYITYLLFPHTLSFDGRSTKGQRFIVFGRILIILHVNLF